MNGKVHNYYEKLVFEQIDRQLKKQNIEMADDLIEDMACIALNKLPPRYVRFDIDTTFYMTPEEIHFVEKSVESAVNDAIICYPELVTFCLAKRTLLIVNVLTLGYWIT